MGVCALLTSCCTACMPVTLYLCVRLATACMSVTLCLCVLAGCLAAPPSPPPTTYVCLPLSPVQREKKLIVFLPPPPLRYSAASAAGKDGTAVQHEFKLLVRECHKRGIEVIMDVVFNHTAEGNEKGVSLSFRWGGV